MARRLAVGLASALLVAPLLLSAASARLPAPSPTPDPNAPSATPTPTATPVCTRSGPTPLARGSAMPDTARGGDTVVLDGSASSGSFYAVEWTQWYGPHVEIADGEAIVSSFVAPRVSAPTRLGFQLILVGCGDPDVSVVSVEMTVLPPAGVASIVVEDTEVAPHGQGNVAVRLHTDQAVARVAHDLAFASPLAIVATAGGKPDCRVAPDLTAAAEFELIPPGCTADCAGVHVEITATSALADGALLYSCTVEVGDTEPAAGCIQPLDCVDASAHDTAGQPLPAPCDSGVVAVSYPLPEIDFTFRADPPLPRPGDAVRLDIDRVLRGGSVRFRTYTLHGTEPFFAQDFSPPTSDRPERNTYQLRAAQAGTAELSVSVTFETRSGCPGHEHYSVEGVTSEPFALTIAGAVCAGDCDADGRVVIAELITGVRIARGDAATTACAAIDTDGSGAVQIDELVAAVAGSLRGCGD